MTYSIVARDPDTGQMGVAVQSRYLGAGAAVPWAEPGVGAVATQAFTEISYGPRGLALIREGASAADALDSLLREDGGREMRQVAMVDGRGVVAVHTGGRCVREAGSATGEQVSAQANMAARPSIWEAMVRAYSQDPGDLPRRLLTALRAAEAEGGDLRGRQSAALLVVSGSREDPPWGRTVDLRVDDHVDPVGELERLLALHRGFEHLALATEHAAGGRLPEALAELDRGCAEAPADQQIRFWRAVALAGNGRLGEARADMERILEVEPGWAHFLRRVAEAGLVPGDPELLQALAPLPETRR